MNQALKADTLTPSFIHLGAGAGRTQSWNIQPFRLAHPPHSAMYTHHCPKPPRKAMIWTTPNCLWVSPTHSPVSSLTYKPLDIHTASNMVCGCLGVVFGYVFRVGSWIPLCRLWILWCCLWIPLALFVETKSHPSSHFLPSQPTKPTPTHAFWHLTHVSWIFWTSLTFWNPISARAGIDQICSDTLVYLLACYQLGSQSCFAIHLCWSIQFGRRQG